MGQGRAKLADARANVQANPSPKARQRAREAKAALEQQLRRSRAWISPAKVVVADTTPTTFELGHNINMSQRSIKFTLSRQVHGRYLPIAVHPFASPSTGGELNGGQIAAWARLDDSGRSGILTFCVDPEARMHSSGAGVFSGDLAFTSSRVQYLEVPVTFSAPYPKSTRVALVGIGICVAASVYVFVLRRPSLPDRTLYGKDGKPTKDEEDEGTRALRMGFGFILGYWRWLTGYSGLVTFAAGLIGAATAFKVQYLASDSWAATGSEWLTFCGAVATAFIAAGTTGRLAQNKYEDQTGGSPGTGTHNPDDGPKGDEPTPDDEKREAAKKVAAAKRAAARRAAARKAAVRRAAAAKKAAADTAATKKAAAAKKATPARKSAPAKKTTTATTATKAPAKKTAAKKTAPRAATKKSTTDAAGSHAPRRSGP